MNRKKKQIFPNLVLMKLSAWHKKNGDEVTLLSANEYIENDLFNNFDEAYGACVFTKNTSVAKRLKRIGVIVGGSGTDELIVLNDEIEHIYPDYDLYGIKDTAYGFLTRGCPRHCPFCIVGDKEGTSSKKVADLSEWWKGQKNIKLLDPNILACENHVELLNQLINSHAWIDITQGMDARLLSDDNIDLITGLKLKTIHFAWDNPRDKIIPTKLKFFKKHTKNLKTDYVKHKCYVLTNYWSTFEEDLYRVNWLRANNFDPYVMIFDKEHASKKIRHLQRWCNNKIIFRSETDFYKYRP